MTATHIAHWPGRDVPVCPEHLAKIQTLGEVLGLAVSANAVRSAGMYKL